MNRLDANLTILKKEVEKEKTNEKYRGRMQNGL
jgi:hypothetical protein